MNLETLFIISLGGAFGVFWIIQYIPIIALISKRIIFSPRLIICKILAPFDAIVTLLLIVGGWTGLLTTVTGISMMTFNVLTGIGISIGVIFTKKFMVPRWEKEFQKRKAEVLQ